MHRRLLKRLSIAALIAFYSTAGLVSAKEFSPNFKGTEVTEFINVISKDLRKTIIVDPNVRGKVSVRSYDLLSEEQYYQFFLNVLQVYGFAVVEMPSGILKVIRDKDAKTSNIPVVEDDTLNGDEMITRVVPVYNVSVRELSPLLRQLIDQAGGGNAVSYDPSNVMMLTGRAAVVNRLAEIIERVDRAGDQEVDIVKLKFASASEMVRIVESIEKSKAGKNANDNLAPRVVADDRTNSVILSGDVKARQRLKTLIERLDQELETSGNTRVVYLNYAKAEDVAKVLQGVSESIKAEEQQNAAANSRARRSNNNRDVSIEPFESSNALVITAEPDMMRSLEEVIRQLDIRRAQVHVEAIIVEVSEGDRAQLGVQWGHEDGGIQQFTNGNVGIGQLAVAIRQAEDRTVTRSTTSANGVPVETDETIQGNFEPLAALMGGFNGTLFGVVKDGWAAVVQAVSSDSNANILATPHITTLDNEEAFFIAGQEVPVVTGSTAGSDNANPFTTVDRQEVGTKLKITPQINEGTAVQLTIEQEVSSVAGALGSDISINKREIKNTVLVDDGATIVIGGLIDEQVNESISKVPLLGDIPVLGHLFKSTATNKTKRNLMVFIRPTIIRDGLTMNKISHRKYQYIRAQQLDRAANGVSLIGHDEQPELPEWNEELALPPTFEEFLMKKRELKDKND